MTDFVTIAYSTASQEADIEITTGSAPYKVKDFVAGNLLTVRTAFTVDDAALGSGGNILLKASGVTVYTIPTAGSLPNSISFSTSGGVARITAVT